jgi:hypothetical protein
MKISIVVYQLGYDGPLTDDVEKISVGIYVVVPDIREDKRHKARYAE